MSVANAGWADRIPTFGGRRRHPAHSPAEVVFADAVAEFVAWDPVWAGAHKHYCRSCREWVPEKEFDEDAGWCQQCAGALTYPD